MRWFRSVASIKQFKSWRSILILFCGTTLGILLDSIVITTGKALIYVKADHPNEVFGAVCGVAVLGNAMLSTLFGSSDKVIKGIPFQDILRYSKLGSDQQLTIRATTWSIFFAVAAYACELYTTLTLLLCLDAFLILAASIDLWNILSDDTKQAEVVNEIIMDESNTQCIVYAENWFDELKKSLDTGNENTVEEYCCMIEKISATRSEIDHPINKAIAHHLPIFFETACEKVGFVDAYKLFKRINHIRPDGFIDCEEVALTYIDSLKYFSDINTHNRHVSKTIESIIDQMKASDWEKTSFVIEYFRAIFENTYLDPKTKKDMLGAILNVLARLSDSDEGEIRKQILLAIVKQHVLLNEDQLDRLYLFRMLTGSLLRKNRYAVASVFIGTVAEILRAFFFYIFLEKDTLDKEYREGLVDLYQTKNSKKDNMSLSFSYLVWEYREQIALWLAEDAVKYDRRRSLFWDYFSPMHSFKHLVWTSSAMTCFAFCFYKLIGYIDADHPFVRILDSDKITDLDKIEVCREILNLYENGQLNRTAKETIDMLESLTEIRNCRDDGQNKPEHEYFQDRLMNLEVKSRRSDREKSEPSEEQILQLVNLELQKQAVFALDNDLQLWPATKIRIEPHLVEMTDLRAMSSTQRIARDIQRIMNGVIARKLRKVSVDFGKEGIHTLLNILGTSKWEYRNYVHVNDYAIPENVKETDEYRKLCAMLEEIYYDRTREIRPYVFLKERRIPYGIKLRYHLSEVNDESCTEYVRQHKIAEGVYQIGINRFDYSHAMRFVRQHFMLETVDVIVRVDVDADSGIVIDFKRN